MDGARSPRAVTAVAVVICSLGRTDVSSAGSRRQSCATNSCIRATAYGALDLGHDLTLVEDARQNLTKWGGSPPSTKRPTR